MKGVATDPELSPVYLSANCPLRGQITDGLVGAARFQASYVAHDMLTAKPIEGGSTVLGALIDVAGNPSEPLEFPPNRNDQNLLKSIAECPGVQEEERSVGFWRSLGRRLMRRETTEKVYVCPALGRFALGPGSNEYRAVKDQLR